MTAALNGKAELNGGELIARQLRHEGIDTVFGVVAGPMLEAFSALPREGIRVIGCRHEENGAMMAAAWGYARGKPGVLIVGAGPAMTNTVTGLYVANENGWPLVVLGGSVHGSRRALGGAQEAPQTAVAAPVCKWTADVDSTYRIPEYIHLALGKATTGRPGAVYVDFPGHIVADKASEERARFRTTSRRAFNSHPDPRGVSEIASMLATAQRPLLLLGEGAAWADAGPQIRELVDTGIPFVASPMGRGTVPDDHPLCFNAGRSTALANADAIVMIGGRFNWLFHFGRGRRFGNPRFAQLDPVAEEMVSGADLEFALVADYAPGASALADALRKRSPAARWSDWVEELTAVKARNEAAVADRASADAKPITHYRLWGEVKNAIDRDAVVVVDGEITLGVGRIVMPSYFPRHRLNCGPTACVGTGVPFAIGAKIAHPDKQVVAVLGDYSFGASAMEIETAARVGANIVFIVDNNAGIVGELIQDELFQKDDPMIASLLPVNYEKMGEMVGAHYDRIEDPEKLGPAIREALAQDRPSVLNVLTDPKAGITEGYNYLMG